ncbi:MAG: serine kinase [Clostridia bacterium]|nr:serine kinase [Clostridia bacterium]MDD4047448.1 serine kinase [Clostridia bacterium]
MELKKIIDNLQLEVLNKSEMSLSTEITGCYIGDLLSNVMANAQAGDIWFTVQTHMNVVAVAQLLNLGGVVFLEGHLPQADTIEKARKEKLVLLSSNDKAYELASSLFKLGLER